MSGLIATGSSTPSTATCPTTSSSSSRSPATCCRSRRRISRRHRLPAQLDDQRGRRHRPRTVPHGGDVRPHGRHRQGHPRRHDPVRAVPQPQVRSAYAGRILPDVRLPQQRRTKRIIAVYTPEAAETRAELLRQITTIEADLQHNMPDWAKTDGGLGGDCHGKINRPGRSFGRSSTPAADQKHYLLDRRLDPRRGVCADEAHDGVHGQDRLKKITAVRLELLNDPEPAAGGPGRSITGAVRADASSASRPRRRQAPMQQSEDRQGDRRRQPSRASPRRHLRRSQQRNTASPGRSSSPSTARTKRPGRSTSGPAAATCRGRRCSSSRSRSSSRRARC